MRRRVLLLSTLVVLPFALAVGIETALAGNSVSRSATGSPPSDTIVVSKSGSGSGTVTSVPAGIDCGKTCTHQYPQHLHPAPLLTATPAARSTFGGWSVSRFRRDRGAVVTPGACPDTAKCRVNIGTYPAVVVATFIAHCVVPNVKGKTLAAAKHSINSRECTLGKITHAASQTIKQGHVLSQTPTQGKWLTQWAKVNLAVSSG